MNIGFSVSETHSINIPDTVDFSDHLLNAIHQHSGWKYSCAQTDDGYFLKPTFRDMPYRNSFVPEISVAISQNNGQLSLNMKGQPVNFVRVFMGIWLVGLLIIEAFLLLFAVVSELDRLFPVFLPVAMCVFGYLLCKIATQLTFRSVVNAIQKEFP